jgi:3-deoxy-D-manno-octulosonate 8-phosphate phosphatase (KDO 8-P phosphatase)
MAPRARFGPELLLKAQGIAVVFIDVDGVLTNGGLHFSSKGETLKRFNTLDGHGLKLLKNAGMVPVVISGRDSKALRLRLLELEIEHAQFGVSDKRLVAESILRRLGLHWGQAAAMGDDWPDLPLMHRCAIVGAPPNAHIEVIAAAHYVTKRHGGDGAVREFCDLLLTARGSYLDLLQEPVS